MRHLSVKYTVIVSVFFMAAGCGRGGSVSKPLPADQIAPVLQQDFKSADTDAQLAVAKIVKELGEQDVANAFTDVKALANLTSISRAQRITAIRAANTIGQLLQDAAQNGDTNALQTMHSYNAEH